MASQNEIQFALSLKNEASATLQQFQTDAKSAMEAAGKATEDYGKKTSQLSQWIKEERAEQRQHNFIFAQTKEVVAGASMVLALYGNTLGQTSESQKMFTNSLNSGFVAFQGVNNLVGLLGKSLSFLAGPWGIAISLAAAGAVAFSQYSGDASKSSEETRKLAAEANELDYRLGRISTSARRAFLLSEIVDAQKKVADLRQTTTDWTTTLMTGGRYGFLTMFKGTATEISQANISLGNLLATYKTFDKTVQQASTQKSHIAKMREELELLTPGTQAYTAKLLQVTKAEEKQAEAVHKSAVAVNEELNPALRTTMSIYGFTDIQHSKMTRSIELRRANTAQGEYALKEIQLNNLQAQLNRELGMYNIFADSVTGTFQNVLGTQFNKMLGEQNSILEIFLGQIGNNLISWGAEQLAATLTNAFISQSATAASIAATEAQMIALAATAAPAALAVNIASFGAAGVAAGITAGTAAAAQTAAMAAVAIPKFHGGGRMGYGGERIALAPDERPAILRVDETVRTKEQESALQQSIGSTFNLHLNFNAPVSGDEFIRSGIDQIMRKMGVTDITKVFVNQRSKLVLAS